MGMCTRWTICTRLPFQSSPTSSSRWNLFSEKKNIEGKFLNHLLSPQASPWPEAEDVAPYVNDDPIFLNLYRCSFIWDKSDNIVCFVGSSISATSTQEFRLATLAILTPFSLVHNCHAGWAHHRAAVWELLQLLQTLQLHLVRRHPGQPWAAQPVAVGDHWRVHLPVPGKEFKFNRCHTYLFDPFHLRRSVSSAASLPRRRKTKLRPWKGTLR